MEIPASSLRARDAYALMTSLIVPRPIAWVSTTSKNQQTNLAPFSYFNGVGSDPPMVTLAIGNLRDGSEKDTLRNIRETGEYCIHLVELPFAEEMNLTSGAFREDESEFELAGLRTLPCQTIGCARIDGVRAGMECRLLDVHTYGRKAKSNLVVGEVTQFFVDEDIYHADSSALRSNDIQPVARLGGAEYAQLGERFELSRPDPEEVRRLSKGGT